MENEPLAPSELILNPDGSLYHIALRGEEIADTVILVGDPNRVPKVQKHFDTVEFNRQKREFHSFTGTYRGLRITCISTGIGTDNVEIVLNELDAAANIDPETRQLRKQLRQLNFIRLGTCGGLHPDRTPGTLLQSEIAIGFDSLGSFYQKVKPEMSPKVFGLTKRFKQYYYISPSTIRFNQIDKAITCTMPGFYAPQGRSLGRIQDTADEVSQMLNTLQINGRPVDNLEMETAGIFLLAELLGHRAASISVVLANRTTGAFHPTPSAAVEHLISVGLQKIQETFGQKV